MKRIDYLKQEIERLQENPTSKCVEWPFAISRGYGMVWSGGNLVGVHRVAYEEFYGKKLKNFALHHCDNRCCFNPHHLYDGTQAQNVQDVMDRGGYKARNAKMRKL